MKELLSFYILPKRHIFQVPHTTGKYSTFQENNLLKIKKMITAVEQPFANSNKIGYM